MRTFVKAATPAAAKTLDAQWYLSADVFARERDRIFARSWICVGHVASLDRPGRFFTCEVAGEHLIVTRDASGALHAFYNVCRHRGTRICTEAAGTFKGSLQCPYHAWTYGLDGSLLAARNMDGVPGFDRADYPLREAHAGEFEGLVFVGLDPAQPFEAYVEPLRSRFASWSLAVLQPAHRIDYDLACNWKLVFENYSECYHCPAVHPQLERLSPSDSGRNDLLEGPFLGGYSELREACRSLTSSGTTARAPLPGVAGEDRTRVYYYAIFPSLLLSLHPDYVMVHRVRPLDPKRTAVTCEWYFDTAATSDPAFDASDAVEFWDLTNRQDWRVNELTQLGIASRAYAPGPYGPDEGLVHAFDRHYLRVMHG